jgi:hypothetical protein
MVSQQGGHSSLAAQPGHLALADASLGTDDQEHFLGPSAASLRKPRFQDHRRGRTASSCRITARSAACHSSSETSGVDGGPYLRDPGASCLFGGRRNNRLPLCVGLGRPVPLPAHDGPFGLPRDDGVDPQFGGGFDGQFIPVTLGQGLDQHQPDARPVLDHDGRAFDLSRRWRRPALCRSSGCRRRQRCPRALPEPAALRSPRAGPQVPQGQNALRVPSGPGTRRP